MNHLNSRSDISNAESICCGAFSGLGTRFFIAPLDLIKIRLQLQPQKVSPKLIAEIVYKVAKNEGFRAFWKGNLPASFLYISYSSCQFGCLRVSGRTLNNWQATRRWPESVKQFCSGAFSGVVSTALTYPFDLLRTRGAANEKQTRSLLATVTSIWRKEGIIGFYCGSASAVLGVVPYMGSFFGIYSLVRESQTMNSLPQWFPKIMSASFAAGALSKFLVMPIDTVRKRVQVRQFRGGNPHFLQLTAHIVRTEGFFALYRGISIALMKSAPSSFLSVYLFELSLGAWRKVHRALN